MKRLLYLLMFLGGALGFYAAATVLLWQDRANRVDPNTLEGKVLFGYQGWFDCPSVPDANPNNWSHWSRGVPRAETQPSERIEAR